LFIRAPSGRSGDLDTWPPPAGVMEPMTKHPLTRPEILIPCLFALWFASAAVYALVFTS
jgi:hypothetical protein